MRCPSLRRCSEQILGLSKKRGEVLLWIELHDIEVISMVSEGYHSLAYIESLQMKSPHSLFQSKIVKRKISNAKEHLMVNSSSSFLLPTPNSTTVYLLPFPAPVAQIYPKWWCFYKVHKTHLEQGKKMKMQMTPVLCQHFMKSSVCCCQRKWQNDGHCYQFE